MPDKCHKSILMSENQARSILAELKKILISNGIWFKEGAEYKDNLDLLTLDVSIKVKK